MKFLLVNKDNNYIMNQEINKKYFVGSGVDVSKDHLIKQAKHQYIEPSNLYLLSQQIGVETRDYVVASDIINQTKYYRILLYEWFLVIKKDGYLIIGWQDNKILNEQKLKSEIDLLVLCKNKVKIVDEFRENNTKYLVLQKIVSVKKNEQEINNWTFGMVTNGKRKDLIQKSLDSIRALKVPNYEIVICGFYDGEIASDIKYIPFSEKDDKGWITKKKNLICENAKYENMVIIHDRIYFDKDWFNNIKKWGNYFDVLSCPIVLPGKKYWFTNWETVGSKWKREDEYRMFHRNAQLDPSDWDFNVYVGGAIIIMKKSIWQIEKWNENLFWGDAEDIEYSQRQHQAGIMIRFASDAKVYSSTVSGIPFVKVFRYKNSKKLGHYKFNPFLFPLRFLDVLGFRRNQKVVIEFLKFVKKLSGGTDWRMKRSRI